MKTALILILFCLLWPAPALAQPPTPDIPYEFEPVEIDEGENPTAGYVAETISEVGFINMFGSYIVTTWSILDNFAGGGVLAYFTVFLAGVVTIKWLANYVYRRGSSGENSSENVGESKARRRRRRAIY